MRTINRASLANWSKDNKLKPLSAWHLANAYKKKLRRYPPELVRIDRNPRNKTAWQVLALQIDLGHQTQIVVDLRAFRRSVSVNHTGDPTISDAHGAILGGIVLLERHEKPRVLVEYGLIPFDNNPPHAVGDA